MVANSRHLVDPELLDMMAASETVVISTDTLRGLREAWRIPFSVDYGPVEIDVEVSSHLADGPEGAPDIDVRVYRPVRRPGPLGCIFHLHGGGYIGGDLASSYEMHRALCSQLRCILVTVNYRLAPETCFPGNIEDCYAALTWLFNHATELGVDSERIGLMGESAGGGLAAALALLTRDRGALGLAFQHLIYPMLDDRTCVSKDPHPLTGAYGWSAQNNHFGWSALLGAAPGTANVSPYAAAARAATLEGLPPTFISTAALDLFVEENLDYARRLTRAGVPVELHMYPGAFHGFDMHPTARVARAARKESLETLARFLRTRT